MLGPLHIVRFLLRAKHFDRAGVRLAGVLDSQRRKPIG
jgi:hypothetical protein